MDRNQVWVFFVSTYVCSFLLFESALSQNIQTVTSKENVGVDLPCPYSANFGNSPRIEWKFKSNNNEQLIFYNGQPTGAYVGRISWFPGYLRFNSVTRQDTGLYSCEVVGDSPGQYQEDQVNLIVEVPPSTPVCYIPTSVTTGSTVTLTCFDKDGSPPCTYNWYRNNVLVPVSPSQIPAFQNTSYILDSKAGTLIFNPVSKADTADYYCQASNGIGPPTQCGAARMEVRDVNVGGIVAAVIIILLTIALIGLAVWYAHRKGYLPDMKAKSQSKPKGDYRQPPAADDLDFKQKSSFVV
ncbi:junctional adhesion molecule A-like [Erpetoichthys calabaricus]|uniref:Junctional adhesion molecule A n=1 Tax=Erpetoichthys calabaricus TaxID=27687 RepID=A0A8C4SRF6_ERPCA|nr:junctional adhesion molecule A-like [Erpetoichthys calabaricus]